MWIETLMVMGLSIGGLVLLALGFLELMGDIKRMDDWDE